MPKQLVIETCAIRHNPDEMAAHHDQGDIVDVPKADAEFLARNGRTLYINKTDDPTKGGLLTASAEMIKAAKDMAKAKDKAAAVEGDPAGQGKPDA